MTPRTFATIAVALAAASSCTTAAKVRTAPGIGVVAKPLERDEYVVLGDTLGKACLEERCVLGFCFSQGGEPDGTLVEGRLFTQAAQTHAPEPSLLPFTIGSQGTGTYADAAEAAALYAAIEALPDADAVLTPRKTIDLTTDDFLVTTHIESCVRVFGKAIRLKTDEEIAMAGAPAKRAPFVVPLPPPEPLPPAPPPPPPPAAAPPPVAPPPAPTTAPIVVPLPSSTP